MNRTWNGKTSLLAVLTVVGLLAGIVTNTRAAVAVTAGTVTGVAPGSYWLGPGYDDHADIANLAAPGIIQFMDSVAGWGGGSDGKIYEVLDLGSVKVVDKIVNVNRLDAPVAPADHAQILVAADESAGGFDPNLASSFTIQVFNGQFTPATATPAVARNADIADMSRRYFLLVYTDTLDGGPITPSNYQVQVGNLDIVLGVPEPSVVMLLGVGGLLVLRRRRQ